MKTKIEIKSLLAMVVGASLLLSGCASAPSSASASTLSSPAKSPANSTAPVRIAVLPFDVRSANPGAKADVYIYEAEYVLPVEFAKAIQMHSKITKPVPLPLEVQAFFSPLKTSAADYWFTGSVQHEYDRFIIATELRDISGKLISQWSTKIKHSDVNLLFLTRWYYTVDFDDPRAPLPEQPAEMKASHWQENGLKVASAAVKDKRSSKLDFDKTRASLIANGGANAANLTPQIIAEAGTIERDQIIIPASNLLSDKVHTENKTYALYMTHIFRTAFGQKVADSQAFAAGMGAFMGAVGAAGAQASGNYAQAAQFQMQSQKFMGEMSKSERESSVWQRSMNDVHRVFEQTGQSVTANIAGKLRTFNGKLEDMVKELHEAVLQSAAAPAQ